MLLEAAHAAVWYNARQEEHMGLVKTRRLAAMHKQQRAKAAMKPQMKGAFRSIPEKAGKGGARIK